MMGLFDSRLFKWLLPKRKFSISPASYRALVGGRASIDKDAEGPAGYFAVVAPSDVESHWRTLDLDTKTLGTMAPAQLLEMMVDLSPEISRGLWDFLRLCNPGYEVQALQGEEMDESAQALLDEFIDLLSDEYGSFDIILNRLFLTAFMRGAFMAELVLDESGRLPIDLVTPDPYTARFRKIDDPVRGCIWELGQYQQTGWVSLDRETIRYMPIDPLPGSPYGRALVSPALFTSLFLLGILHDLRRVVAQQGYPRLDLEIVMERLHDAMPANLEGDPEAVKDWVQAIIDEVEDVYSELEPDDAYIHTDVVKVNRPVGTIDATSLSAIDDLIRALERMAARALKTMPLLMGIMDATTETNANRQWEIQAAGIKSIQHLLETMLERLFGLALQAQGVLVDVRFRFAELREAERLRDAQTESMEINNAFKMYQTGWISQDEASEMVTGSPADVPEPRTVMSSLSPDPNVPLDVPDRQVLLEEIRAAQTQVSEAFEMFRANGHKELT